MTIDISIQSNHQKQIIPCTKKQAKQQGEDQYLYLDDLNPFEIKIKITERKSNISIMLWSFMVCVGDESFVGFDINDWINNLHGEAALQEIQIDSNLNLNKHYTKEQALNLVAKIVQQQTLIV